MFESIVRPFQTPLALSSARSGTGTATQGGG
jgi:hypothetical protein